MNGSQNIIYAPTWVKVVTIILLSGALIGSAFVTFHFLGRNGKEDHILTALAIGQIAISGIAVSLVLFFAEREISVGGLRKKSHSFLSKEMKEGLSRIDYHESFGDRGKFSTYVDCEVNFGDTIAIYTISCGDLRARIRIGFNIKRMTVMLFIPEEGNHPASDILSALDATLAGASNAGYTYHMVSGQKRADGHGPQHELFLYNNNLGADFLTNSASRLFWIQDTAIMIHSLLVEIGAHDIKLKD